MHSIWAANGGKTKVTIDVISNHTDKIRRVLIVCPHSVVSVWPQQIKLHSDMDAVIASLDSGTVAQKQRKAELTLDVAAAQNKVAIVVINYESLWREPFASWALTTGFDLVVLDESHRGKAHEGKTAKFCEKLGRTVPYRLGLTGTPLPHALASTSHVLTPHGWLQIQDLHVGDLVIGKNGLPTKVLGVWPQGEQPLSVVKFCDGAETICTDDHLWSVISRGRRCRGIGYITIKTENLNKPRPLPNSNEKTRTNGAETLFDAHGAPRWSIPLPNPISFESSGATLPIDPYLLGVLLGDGHIGHSVDFTTADQDVVDEVTKALPTGLKLTNRRQNGKASRYRITSGKKGGSVPGKNGGAIPNQLIQDLDSLGLTGSRSHNKFVPTTYLWSSIDARTALLQGLCDTDGSSYGSTSKFITTSRQLANDVAFLVRSLGGIVKTSTESKKNTLLPSGKRIDGRDQYHLFFSIQINPFRLKRKAEKFKISWRTPSRNIVAITPSGVGDATCITVEAEDGLFVTEDFVVTHNSPLDAYGQYRFLDPGIVGTSFSRFRNDYALMGGFQGHQVLQYRNLDDLASKMYSIGFRVMSKDVFDLPPFQDVTREFDLDLKDRAMYQEMEDDFCVMVKDVLVTAENALVKILRLQELTSGFLEGMPVNIGKKKLLEDVMEDFEKKEPIVIFARFTNDLKSIREVAENQGRTYAELSGHAHELQKWQAGEADVLGVQIKSGREGVDFTRARYCVYYSIGPSLGDYNQSRKRLDRPGQTREGVYIHLIAKGTIDSAVMVALERREEIVESVLRQYRERKQDGSSNGNVNTGRDCPISGVTGGSDRI